jgi:hypothetical protein
VINPADDNVIFTVSIPLDDIALNLVIGIFGIPPLSVCRGVPLKIDDKVLVRFNMVFVELPVNVPKIDLSTDFLLSISDHDAMSVEGVVVS